MNHESIDLSGLLSRVCVRARIGKLNSLPAERIVALGSGQSVSGIEDYRIADSALLPGLVPAQSTLLKSKGVSNGKVIQETSRRRQLDAESLKFALPHMTLRSSSAAGKRAEVEIAGVEAVTGRPKTGRAFFFKSLRTKLPNGERNSKSLALYSEAQSDFMKRGTKLSTNLW